MELTGGAANRTLKGDEESERRREGSARSCSVRVERLVRRLAGNSAGEVFTIFGEIQGCW